MDPQAPNTEVPEVAMPETPHSTNESINNSSGDSHGITIAAMALFILMSLGVIIFLYYQNQQLKSMLASYQTPVVSPTPVATTDPTANWKTYADPKYNFSIKYPQNYKAYAVLENISVAGPATGTSTSLQTIADPQTIQPNTDTPFDGFSLYFVSDSTTLNFESYINKEFAVIKTTPTTTNKAVAKTPLTTINGVKGYTFELSDSITIYYFPTPDKKSVVAIAESYSNPQAKSNFDQILSTFKFTSPSPTLVPSNIPVSTSSALPNGIY